MSSDLARARLLRERKRHEEAVAMLLSHLAHHPEDPNAFVELAINRSEIPGQLNLALSDARTAGGLSPEHAYPVSLQSRILAKLHRFEESLETADIALEMDANLFHGWISRSIALLDLGRLKEGEDSARTCLSLHPDDPTASNLLMLALRLQSRLDDSDSVVRHRLSIDPDNAFLFANAGFTALQRGEIKLSETRFRESLRINPQLKHAKDGLKEAYRARSAFYRLFLKWSVFGSKLPSNHIRGGFMVTCIAGSLLIIGNILAENPPHHMPIIGLFLLFLPVLFLFIVVFFAILCPGIGNFLILMDPAIRGSLDQNEKIQGLLTASLFFGGSIALLAGGLVDFPPCLTAGGAMIAAAVPASLACVSSLKGRTVFSVFLVVIMLLGGSLTLDALNHPDRHLVEGNFALFSFYISLIVTVSAVLRRNPSFRSASPQ